jgi:hypothetical protein
MALHTFTSRLMVIALIAGLTLGFMMVSSPADIPAVLLVVPFIGLFTVLYMLVLEVVRYLGPDEDENGAIVQVRRPRLMSAVIAGFPVLLLILQSVVELTLWDVLIAVLILILAYIYVARGSASFWRRRQ